MLSWLDRDANYVIRLKHARCCTGTAMQGYIDTRRPLQKIQVRGRRIFFKTSARAG